MDTYTVKTGFSKAGGGCTIGVGPNKGYCPDITVPAATALFMNGIVSTTSYALFARAVSFGYPMDGPWRRSFPRQRHSFFSICLRVFSAAGRILGVATGRSVAYHHGDHLMLLDSSHIIVVF